MHYYQHHVGDFIRDTSRLSDAQCMAYLRLIWMYYDTEQPLTTASDVLALKIGSEQKTVDLILGAFFQQSPEGWRHKRCDQEIESYHAFIAKQKANGSRGGRPPKTHGLPSGSPEDSDGHPRHNPNHYPLSNNHSSVPDGTGAKAPLTTDEIIFTYGVPLLVNAGSTDKAARSFLGGLRKGHGDQALVDALRECLKAKPMQPLEWLAAILPPKGGPPRRNKQEELEESNRAVVARLLEKEAQNAAG